VPSETVGKPRRPRGPSCRSRRCVGFTLTELLVAVAVSATGLGAAWPWLWNTAEGARAIEARAQASTAAAFATRSIMADLELATGLMAPPAGMVPASSLHIRQRRPGDPAESVLIGWDPARQVLWRKTPSSYLADHVETFAITYFDRLGKPLGPAAMTLADWPQSVARVRVALVVTTRTGRSSTVHDALVGRR
jgi:prepilin-type N-terminal cleavage/methylation domain-containing protein